MKIESPLTARSVGSVRKSEKKAGGEGFARVLEADGEEGVTATSGIHAPATVSSIDALLSVQEMSGEQENARAKKRGDALLDKLDEIRHALLTGALEIDRLEDLVSLLKDERAQVTDTGLGETLDAIELLARVELAKLGREV